MIRKQFFNLILLCVLGVALVVGVSYLPKESNDISIYEEGIYYGMSQNENGEIWVKALFSSKNLLSLDVVNHSETMEGIEDVIKDFTSKFVTIQSSEVMVESRYDSLTTAIKEAVTSCFEQALGNKEIVNYSPSSN